MNEQKPGYVYLVGAGPGDFGLITLKGLQAIEQADVLVYDRLINANLIHRAPAACEKIYVGKQAANHALPQDQINELLYQKAEAGQTVVRLKGGDPYVFGRGGEEGIYLAERGIPFEVIPGVTSCIAGPAYAGIPVTHRECASSFHVFTGNFKDELRGLNFPNLAELEGTLIFLMGFGNLPYITQGLISAGKPAATPVAVVSHATTGSQQTVCGTLADIEQKVREAGLTPPAITIVGGVVNCREQLNFFEQRRRPGVLVLRDARQSSPFAKMLREAGFHPVSCPVIRIEPLGLTPPLQDAIENIGRYTWLVFTSPNGVTLFFRQFFAAGGDLRQMAGLKFAAIGKATAENLQKTGFRADYVPNKQVSDSLAQGLAKQLTAADCVLLPRSAIANNNMAPTLAAKCRVDDIPLYDTKVQTGCRDELKTLLSSGEVQYIPFTSASTVDGFYQAIGGDMSVLAGVKCAAIGPVTARRMQELGITPALTAAEHSLDGVLAALKEDAQI